MGGAGRLLLGLAAARGALGGLRLVDGFAAVGEGVCGEVAVAGLVAGGFFDEVSVAVGVGEQVGQGRVAVGGRGGGVEALDDALLGGEVVGDSAA